MEALHFSCFIINLSMVSSLSLFSSKVPLSLILLCTGQQTDIPHPAGCNNFHYADPTYQSITRTAASEAVLARGF
jgi:hypothetical protein